MTISMLCQLQRVATLHPECFFIQQPWQSPMGLEFAAPDGVGVLHVPQGDVYILHINISYLMNSDGHGDGIAAVAFQRLFFIQTPLQKQRITENRKHTILFFPAARAQVFVLRLFFIGRLQPRGKRRLS